MKHNCLMMKRKMRMDMKKFEGKRKSDSDRGQQLQAVGSRVRKETKQEISKA